MGVTKQTITYGNGVDFARPGDSVAIQYTGWLYDVNHASNGYKGKQFDTSTGRGDLQTQIGIGQVIRGWDEGIVGSAHGKGMSLGEKAYLTITSDFGYGSRGFPGLIPGNSHLIFEVKLISINGKRA